MGAELTADLAPYAAALAVGEAVREQVTYRPGTTGVATSAIEAWGESHAWVEVWLGA